MKLKLIVIGCVILSLMFISRFVWIGDVFSGREVVVGIIYLPNRETVELVQLWNGDGYMTFVRHRSRVGLPHTVVGNPDAIKAWSVAMELEQELGHVRMRFNGKEWNYYYNSHSLTQKRTAY